MLGKVVPVGEGGIRVPRDMAWCFEGGTFYERNVTHWLERVLRPRRTHVFYDVGANIGFYTVLAAQRVDRVYAFEPVRKTFEVLAENVRRNRLSNVEIFRVGLSDENGRRDIHIYSSSGNNSIHRRALPRGHALRWMGTEEVTLTRADDLVSDKGLLPPTVVKVDVEGAELPVLRGASALLAAYRPVLFVEFSKGTLRDAGYGPADLLAEMRRHDYSIFGLARDARDLTLYEIDEGVPVANVVAFADAAAARECMAEQ